MLEINIRKLLDEIPNGHDKYRLTSNGKLVDRDDRGYRGPQHGYGGQQQQMGPPPHTGPPPLIRPPPHMRPPPPNTWRGRGGSHGGGHGQRSY